MGKLLRVTFAVVCNTVFTKNGTVLSGLSTKVLKIQNQRRFTPHNFVGFIGFFSFGNILENVAATVFSIASVSAVGGFGLQTLRFVIDGTDGLFLSGGTAKFYFSLAVTE